MEDPRGRRIGAVSAPALAAVRRNAKTHYALLTRCADGAPSEHRMTTYGFTWLQELGVAVLWPVPVPVMYPPPHLAMEPPVVGMTSHTEPYRRNVTFWVTQACTIPAGHIHIKKILAKVPCQCHQTQATTVLHAALSPCLSSGLQISSTVAEWAWE